MSIPKITFQQYHQIANKFLRQIGFSGPNLLPLDIEMMIEKAGHNIVPIQNLYNGFGVKGVVLKKNRWI